MYDISTKRSCNWAKRLHHYARLRNDEVHSSLGLTPFKVYYGRSKLHNSFGNDSLEEIRAKRSLAMHSSNRQTAEMLERYEKRHPVGSYL